MGSEAELRPIAAGVDIGVLKEDEEFHGLSEAGSSLHSLFHELLCSFTELRDGPMCFCVPCCKNGVGVGFKLIGLVTWVCAAGGPKSKTIEEFEMEATESLLFALDAWELADRGLFCATEYFWDIAGELRIAPMEAAAIGKLWVLLLKLSDDDEEEGVEYRERIDFLRSFLWSDTTVSTDTTAGLVLGDAPISVLTSLLAVGAEEKEPKSPSKSSSAIFGFPEKEDLWGALAAFESTDNMLFVPFESEAVFIVEEATEEEVWRVSGLFIFGRLAHFFMPYLVRIKFSILLLSGT